MRGRRGRGRFGARPCRRRFWDRLAGRWRRQQTRRDKKSTPLYGWGHGSCESQTPPDQKPETQNANAKVRRMEEVFGGKWIAVGCSGDERAQNIRRGGDWGGSLRRVDGVAPGKARQEGGAGRGVWPWALASEQRGRDAHHSHGVWRR